MAEWLVALKVDVVLVKESLRGKGPVYVFRDAGIELRQTGASTLYKALEAQWATDGTTINGSGAK